MLPHRYRRQKGVAIHLRSRRIATIPLKGWAEHEDTRRDIRFSDLICAEAARALHVRTQP